MCRFQFKLLEENCGNKSVHGNKLAIIGNKSGHDEDIQIKFHVAYVIRIFYINKMHISKLTTSV